LHIRASIGTKAFNRNMKRGSARRSRVTSPDKQSSCWASSWPPFWRGCQRAPSFDLLGSFFPVWIFCVAAGIIAAVVFRQVLIRLKYDSEVGPAIVIYPCFAALVAFLSWLVFFR
jgi:hypothetical protein